MILLCHEAVSSLRKLSGPCPNSTKLVRVPIAAASTYFRSTPFGQLLRIARLLRHLLYPITDRFRHRHSHWWAAIISLSRDQARERAQTDQSARYHCLSRHVSISLIAASVAPVSSLSGEPALARSAIMLDSKKPNERIGFSLRFLFQYPMFVALSQTDFTEDLKKISVPVLIALR